MPGRRSAGHSGDQLPEIGERVRWYLRQRRRREQLFPPRLFADPAWDILLDLYVSELDGRKVSVSDACNASAVPSSTGLRCIDRLVARGLIHRSASDTDGRVIYLCLSSDMREIVAEWVSQAFS